MRICCRCEHARTGNRRYAYNQVMYSTIRVKQRISCTSGGGGGANLPGGYHAREGGGGERVHRNFSIVRAKIYAY